MTFSPDDIEQKDFLVTIRGYDKDEVRAFLNAIAADYEMALSRAREAEESKDKPYEALGNELGHVLQAAKDSADQLRKRAEKEVVAIRQRTEQEAIQIREATNQAAQKLRQEAERHANEVRVDAEQFASQLRASVKKETDDRIRETARRVQRLQQAEAKIRERLVSLDRMIAEAREELFVDDEAEVKLAADEAKEKLAATGDLARDPELKPPPRDETGRSKTGAEVDA